MTEAFTRLRLAAHGAIPASAKQRRVALSTMKTSGHYRVEREIADKNSLPLQISTGL